jgi:hypothetical protein
MKMAATALKADSSVHKPIADLSIEATRAQLTPAAIEAFLGLSRIWRLTTRQSIALLGEGSERTWFRIKAKAWVGVLSQDSLTRVGALVGLYKELHLIFSEPLANEWVRRAGTEDVFAGATPLDYMIRGGIPAMLEIRSHVDALRADL